MPKDQEYFTAQEIRDVKAALDDVSKVGINIKSYKSNSQHMPDNEQLRTFFDKAKIWRVIERIISAFYIQRLSEGKMFLHDSEGDEYRVIKVEP